VSKSQSIKVIINSAYLRTAIMPILLIELTLLFMYFSITTYLATSSRDTLQEEATRNITEIASREARILDHQIREITRYGLMLQKENSRLFSKPEAFTLPNGVPSFARADNGVHYKTADNGGSSLWYPTLRRFTAAERKKAIMTEAMDPLYKTVLESNPNIVGIYFNSHDSMNRYYPFLPDVWGVFTPAMDIPTFNFYYLADEAHDPAREVVWTDAYLDPAGQGWMASCIAPIYRGDFLEGVTGIDVTVDRLVKNILSLDLPWSGAAFLVDREGVILAMPESIESVLGLKELREQVYTSYVTSDTVKPEEFNLFTNKDPLVADQIKELFTAGRMINDFKIGGKEYFLTQSVIAQTGWRLLILVDKDIVNEPVATLEKLTRRVGVIAFSMMVVFYFAFFSYLLYRSRKTAERIATPLRLLADRTTHMKDDLASGLMVTDETEIDELNLLNHNFINMAKELGMIYGELDRKVQERTAELEGALKNLTTAHEQIIQQEKMASIGQLAAGVAHEINNPMAFIMSNVTLMRSYFSSLKKYIELLEAEDRIDKVALEARRRELTIGFIQSEIDPMIQETLEGTERVKKIVNELRTFSRMTVDMEMSDLNAGIRSVTEILANELKYKADVELNLGDLPLVFCNTGQLNQVFMNIIINAAQAIIGKGRIGISSFIDGDSVKVRIEDNGPGMSSEVMKSIFNPFFTTKEPGKGTGLGLSVSYEIVKKHKGDIEVSSELGRGTIFTVTIPVVAPDGGSVPAIVDQPEE